MVICSGGVRVPCTHPIGMSLHHRRHTPAITYCLPHPSSPRSSSCCAAADAAIGTLASTTLACSTIDPILSSMFIGLCNDGIATIIGMFRILIAASVLLIIQLGIGADICCYHPGDKSRWLTDEEREEKLTGNNKDAVANGQFQMANPQHGYHSATVGPGVPKTGHATAV